MIYEFPAQADPIRQGDIFIGLPRIEISLSKIVLAEEDSERIAKWKDLASQTNPISILIIIQRTYFAHHNQSWLLMSLSIVIYASHSQQSLNLGIKKIRNRESFY